MKRTSFPATLEPFDWPLQISRAFWLLTPKPFIDKNDRPTRVFKMFATPDERTAWLVAHGYGQQQKAA